jgi:RNA polymerase sigma factor (sigma-70 family)
MVSDFPETQLSAVVAVREGTGEARRRALERLIAGYWKPVFKYLRVRWRADHDDAADWTQGFFAKVLESEIVDRFDPARGRFRTWLRVAIDGYVSNEKRAAGRQKRGGDRVHLSLDFEGAERELGDTIPAEPVDPDRYFDQEFVRGLFEAAVGALEASLRGSGRERRWDIFAACDLAGEERPTYRELAARFGEPETQITNHLAAARRELRRHLLSELRSLTASPEEYEEEARRLFGDGALPGGGTT